MSLSPTVVPHKLEWNPLTTRILAFILQQTRQPEYFILMMAIVSTGIQSRVSKNSAPSSLFSPAKILTQVTFSLTDKNITHRNHKNSIIDILIIIGQWLLSNYLRALLASGMRSLYPCSMPFLCFDWGKTIWQVQSPSFVFWLVGGKKDKKGKTMTLSFFKMGK